ncbi:hypothetical protein ACFX13_010789 [Malus domestica]
MVYQVLLEIWKLAALQNEFDNVKKKMDDDIQKAASIENKVKVHTYGYEDASRFRNHCGRSIDKPGAACHCLSTGCTFAQHYYGI